MPPGLKSNLMSLKVGRGKSSVEENEEWEGGNYKGYNIDEQRESRLS